MIVGTAFAGLLGRAGGAGRGAAVDGLPRDRPEQAARPGELLILPILRGRDPGQVAGMTAMSMGVGYLIASTGPATSWLEGIRPISAE